MDQYFDHMVHILSLVIQLNPAKISFQLFFINLMVNYDQIVFKIHVNIINLMKKTSHFDIIRIPANQSEFMNQMPHPLVFLALKT